MLNFYRRSMPRVVGLFAPINEELFAKHLCRVIYAAQQYLNKVSPIQRCQLEYILQHKVHDGNGQRTSRRPLEHMPPRYEHLTRKTLPKLKYFTRKFIILRDFGAFYKLTYAV